MKIRPGISFIRIIKTSSNDFDNDALDYGGGIELTSKEVDKEIFSLGFPKKEN